MQHFTIAYGCVLLMAILPIICAGLAKINGLATTASAAQTHTFEALPFFFAAVIIAHLLGAIQIRLDILSLIFVLLRVLYVMLYMAGVAGLRSIIWTAAFAVNIAILFLGFR